MTIYNIAKLPEASFRNVDFNYQDGSLGGGRKTVTHEYPDADFRYVEDLGKLQKTFTINALVDINRNNSTRNRLISALEQAGPGTFVHPLYGNQSVVVKGFTATDNINELGIVKFNIVFEKAEGNKFPQGQTGNKGFISKLKDLVYGDAETDLSDNWASVKNKITNFNAAVDKNRKSAREIKRVAALIEGSTDGINDLQTSLNELSDSSTALVQSPENLATAYDNVINNIEAAFESPEDAYVIGTNLFTFNAGDENIVGTSTNQQERENNQDQINIYMSATCMALSYNSAANMTYGNLDDLNEVRDTLENGFAALPSGIGRDVYQNLQKIRIESNNLFDNLALSLARIINLNTNPVSLNVLTYSLYGSLDNKSELIDLNSLIDVSRVSGDIKVLSSV